jgi:tryptophan-rich sensory protein
MRWVLLLTSLVLCFGVAFLGGQWTASEIPGWYRTLVRPSIAPPNWIFAPVWTFLYLTMAIAAWMVTQSVPSSQRTIALLLFLLQLALNLAWSWIFFRQHALGAALVEVVLMWIAVGATTAAFRPVAPWAAGLMLPYWAWVTFAAVLNAAFWRVNVVPRT